MRWLHAGRFIMATQTGTKWLEHIWFCKLCTMWAAESFWKKFDAQAEPGDHDNSRIIDGFFVAGLPQRYAKGSYWNYSNRSNVDKNWISSIADVAWKHACLCNGLSRRCKASTRTDCFSILRVRSWTFRPFRLKRRRENVTFIIRRHLQSKFTLLFARKYSKRLGTTRRSEIQIWMRSSGFVKNFSNNLQDSIKPCCFAI